MGAPRRVAAQDRSLEQVQQQQRSKRLLSAPGPTSTCLHLFHRQLEVTRSYGFVTSLTLRHARFRKETRLDGSKAETNLHNYQHT